jgi:hypothetical protein
MNSSLPSSRSFRRALLTCALLAAGCSPVFVAQHVASTQPPVAPPQSVQQELAPLPPESPVGHFRSLSNPGGLVLAFHDRHHFQVLLDNALLDSGLLNVVGTQVAIDSLKCAAHGDRPALYSWLYAESDLTFQAVTPDPCAERRQYLAEEYEPLYLFIHFSPAPEIQGGAS